MIQKAANIIGVLTVRQWGARIKAPVINRTLPGLYGPFQHFTIHGRLQAAAVCAAHRRFPTENKRVGVILPNYPPLHLKGAYKVSLDLRERFRTFSVIPGVPVTPPHFFSSSWRGVRPVGPLGALPPSGGGGQDPPDEGVDPDAIIEPPPSGGEDLFLQRQTFLSDVVPSSYAGPGKFTPPNTNIQPNVVKSRFLVSRPNTVWLSDICEIKEVAVDEIDGKHMQVYTILDLGDGRIVGHCCHEKVTDAHVVNVLTPLVAAQQQIKRLYPQNETQALIVHSDRGEQFRSNIYWNQHILFEGFLFLSHSYQAEPTNNSPQERIQRTLFRKPFKYWQLLGYPDGPPKRVATKQQLRDLIAAIIELYNSTHANERSLGLTPREASWAFMLADEAGIKHPDAWLSSPQVASNETALIETYLEQVRINSWRYMRTPPASLAALRESQRINEQTLIRKMTIDTLQQLTELNETLAKAKAQFANPAFTKQAIKKKKLDIPRELRDPFSLMAMEAFTQYVMGGRIVHHYNIRNIIAVIVLVGLGIRISEVVTLKHFNIQELLKHRQTSVRIPKQKKTLTKVIDKYSHEKLTEFYNLYCQLMEVQKITFKAEDYFFVRDLKAPNNTESSACLSVKHFTEAINRLLNRFLVQYNAKNNVNLHLTSHSGRIGFVTRSLEAGNDLLITSQLVGHESPSTTARYNRYLLSNAARLEAVDRASKIIHPPDPPRGESAEKPPSSPKLET